MNTLAERLSYILKERGKSAADLARATGKTESAVSQWLSGETKSMRSDSLMAACALLSCSPQWLASGKGPIHQSNADAAALAHFSIHAKEIYGLGNDETPSREYVQIKESSIKFSAGNGRTSTFDELEDSVPATYRLDWFTKNGINP